MQVQKKDTLRTRTLSQSEVLKHSSSKAVAFVEDLELIEVASSSFFAGACSVAMVCEKKAWDPKRFSSYVSVEGRALLVADEAKPAIARGDFSVSRVV